MSRKIYHLFLIVFTFFIFAAQLYAQDDATIINNGDMMPEFKITSSEGVINSSDLKGKVVLINFFATWCPPCRKELPYVEKQIWNKYKDRKDFELMIIGREHSLEEMTKFKEGKFQMPFYPDKDRSVYSKFALNTIPRNYIINRKGKVVYTSIGFSDKEFEEMLKLLKTELGS